MRETARVCSGSMQPAHKAQDSLPSALCHPPLPLPLPSAPRKEVLASTQGGRAKEGTTDAEDHEMTRDDKDTCQLKQHRLLLTSSPALHFHS